jgi:hypothetical protein
MKEKVNKKQGKCNALRITNSIVAAGAALIKIK